MGVDFQDEDDKRDVNAVLHLTLKKHQEVFKQIFADGDMVMYEAYKEFFRHVIFPDEFARTKAEGEAKGKVIMAIRMGRKYRHPDYEIIADLSSEINCSHEEATNLFHQYCNAQQAVSAY